MPSSINKFRSLILLAAFLLILGAGCDNRASEPRQITLVFRYDDYSALSSPDMAQKIIAIFRAHQVVVTFGVIPFISSGDVEDSSPQDTIPLQLAQGELLRRASAEGLLEVALHGYSHQTHTAGPFAEFSGLPYDEQIRRLTQGQAHLQELIGVPVRTFIPPWNQYDLNTLHALEELGFDTLSAGMDGAARSESTLNFLPGTSELADLPQALAAARRANEPKPLIVVLFHAYDFKEFDPIRGQFTYSALSEILDEVSSQADVSIMTLAQASTAVDGLDAAHFLRTQRVLRHTNLLPPLLSPAKSPLFYWSETLVGTFWRRVATFYALVAALGFALASLLWRWLQPRPARTRTLLLAGAAILAILVILYAWRDLAVDWLGGVATALLVAGWLGLALGMLKTKDHPPST